MRKNFDYVDFKDYQSDMDELGTNASNVIATLKQELDLAKRDKDRLLAAAVLAAGGKVEITDRHLIEAGYAEITQIRNDRERVTVIEVKLQTDMMEH